MKTIALSAVMYSPNLGDGVIAECFTSAVSEATSHSVGVNWLDLAGRTSFSSGTTGQMRTYVLDCLNRLPARYSRILSRFLVSQQVAKKFRPLAERVIPSVDGVVVGGGQLFSDANLNFPIKLESLAKTTESYRKPLAISCVGVASEWNSEAYERFGKLLKYEDIRSISVRDKASKRNLLKHLSNLNIAEHPQVFISLDPGFLASRTVDKSDSIGAVGIGVTHPAALINHGLTDLKNNETQFAERYLRLASELTKRGRSVVFFTNGSTEDVAFLEVVRKLCVCANGITFAARSECPKQLMSLISSFEGVISHRMHACIVAFSYQVPFVGLSWDEKLTGVFDSMGRKEFLCSGLIADPMEAVELLAQSETSPVENIAHSRALSAAAEGIHRSIGSLSSRPARA